MTSPIQPAPPRSWYARVWWSPLLASLAVLVGGLFARAPIGEVSGAQVPEATLVRPVGYLAIAPLSDVLDTLTLLSAAQHFAIVLGLLVVFVAHRAVVAITREPPLRSHVIALAIGMGVIILVYLAAIALPRPMASLAVSDANIIRVDFHTHSSASHDGRGGWSSEDVRAWHGAAGFDALYLTDHGVVREAEKGIAGNPATAGDGVTVLQGMEVAWKGEHVGILSAERTFRGLLTNGNRDIDEQSLTIANMVVGREPVLVWHHPRKTGALPTANRATSTSGVRAIEVVNGGTDAIGRVHAERDTLLNVARANNLPLTSGTDNHGWGRASPGWTLLFVVGWRAMESDALAQAIEKTLREGGFTATRVMERRVADPGSQTMAAVAVIAVPAVMLTTLSNDERVVWLVWIWLIAGIAWWMRRRARA